MKRLTASVILALAVVAGAPGGSGGGALAHDETLLEVIENAINALENGITVAPENRCTPYDPKDYSYNSRELKNAFIAHYGGDIWSLYTGEHFASLDEVDLDHTVALSEAHDSGACTWSSKKRKDFVNDPGNHELASLRLNREEKQDKDWAEWQTPLKSVNLWWWCFTAGQIVETKRRYGLTVDQAEYDALVETITHCRDFYAKLRGTEPAAPWD